MIIRIRLAWYAAPANTRFHQSDYRPGIVDELIAANDSTVVRRLIKAKFIFHACNGH